MYPSHKSMAIKGSEVALPEPLRHGQANRPDYRTGQRAYKCHPKLHFRAGRVLLDLRNAAQSKERDLLHWQILGSRHQRVRQFVKQQRHEKQEGGPNRHGRDQAITPLRIAGMELR